MASKTRSTVRCIRNIERIPEPSLCARVKKQFSQQRVPSFRLLHSSAVCSSWGYRPSWLFSEKMHAWMNDQEGRKLVGKDKAGNQFWEIPNPGGHPDPRREVTPASPNPEDFDMNSVPNEWRTWLYHYRDASPTEQEISDADTQRQAIYERAVELDKQDASRRQAEMQAQMDAAGISADGGRVPLSASPTSTSSASGPSSEASGTGDSFQVGVFDPTKL